MPKRIVFRVVNAEGVSESRPQDEITAAIVKPSVYGVVDVWLLCEIAWADLKSIADKHDLFSLHYGERGSAEAGVGILSRRPIGEPAILTGSRPVPGVRMRPFATGRTYGVRVTAGHAPPGRTPDARSAYLSRLRKLGGVVGLDANQRPRWMRDYYLRQYRGIGVLGLLIPLRYRASKAVGVDVGSDHDAVDVVLTRR